MGPSQPHGSHIGISPNSLWFSVPPSLLTYFLSHHFRVFLIWFFIARIFTHFYLSQNSMNSAHSCPATNPEWAQRNWEVSSSEGRSTRLTETHTQTTSISIPLWPGCASINYRTVSWWPWKVPNWNHFLGRFTLYGSQHSSAIASKIENSRHSPPLPTHTASLLLITQYLAPLPCANPSTYC